MKAICTYCAGPKRQGGRLLPAVRRYISPRINDAHKLARKRGAAFFILSGEYGLLRPDDPIPWYDHLLRSDEVKDLVPKVAVTLVKEGIESVEYHTASPDLVPAIVAYFDVLRQACVLSGISLEIVLLVGNPD